MISRTRLRLIGSTVIVLEAILIGWHGQSRRHEEARRQEEAAAARLQATRAREIRASARAPQAGTDPAKPQRQPTPGSFAARFSQALKNPVFLGRLATVQKAMIAEHYGPLLNRLQLEPQARDRFTALLAEKQLAKTDAEAAGNDLVGTGLMIPAIAAAQADVNAQIQQVLGPAAYQAYYDFEMTDGLRTTVHRLQEALRYSDSPLSDAQAESLVTALDQVTPPEERGGIAKFTGASVEVAAGLVSPAFSAPLPAAAPQAARALLSAPQRAQLEALMRQQQDELQLRAQTLAALHASTSAP
jgi:hypothetical protein